MTLDLTHAPHRKEKLTRGSRRPTRWIMLLASAWLLGCALASVKTVNGVSYELSGAETTLADEMLIQSPRTGPMEARCKYWKGARHSLDASPRELAQRAGIVMGATSNYQALRGWTEEYVRILCAAAADEHAKAMAAQGKKEEENEYEVPADPPK